jgi:hypothetical protein
MGVYMIDADRIGPWSDHKYNVKRERCFVEAGSMSSALALRPENDEYQIISIQMIGNIIAREPAIVHESAPTEPASAGRGER